jgi:hypothetical protein
VVNTKTLKFKQITLGEYKANGDEIIFGDKKNAINYIKYNEKTHSIAEIIDYIKNIKNSKLDKPLIEFCLKIYAKYDFNSNQSKSDSKPMHIEFEF